MKSTVTWILVADQESAVFYSHRSGEEKFEPVSGTQYVADPSDQPVDRPGRTFSSAGNRRHTYIDSKEPGSEIANHVIGVLSDGLQGKSFARFILCAPPKILGHLRQAMPGPLVAMSYGELPKNLVNVPQTELPKHFKDMLPV